MGKWTWFPVIPIISRRRRARGRPSESRARRVAKEPVFRVARRPLCLHPPTPEERIERKWPLVFHGWGERERRRRKKEKEEPSDKLLLSSFLSLLFPTFRLRDGRCSPTTFDKLLFQTENRPLLPCSSSRLSARLFPHSSRNSWRGGGGDCSFQRSRGAGSGSKKLGDGQGDHFNRTRTAFGNAEKWDITNGIKDYSFGGNALIGRLSGTGAQQSTDRSENGTVGQPFRGCQSWRAVIDRKVGRFTSSTVASSLLAAYLGKFVDDSSVPLFSISFSVLAHPPDLRKIVSIRINSRIIIVG